jgi:cytochrome c peroxidase
MVRPSLGVMLAAACVAGCGARDEAALYQAELAKLTGLGPPPRDHSNAYETSTAAIALGKQFYFDPGFSGLATHADMLLRPLDGPGRAPEGEEVELSCNTCHDLARGGADPTTDPPGNVVSFGAGAYDVNGQQTFNAAYHRLYYWNGRNDSLWSQVFAVVESHVSLGGNRMRLAWRIAEVYREAYARSFPEYPLPPAMDSIAAQEARLEPDGRCRLVRGECPEAWCHTTYGPCLPRFPLDGRPGWVFPGELPVCEWGSRERLLQPHGDAWDCMTLADQLLVTRIFVNYAKAVAAFERTLISEDSDFDRWVASRFSRGVLTPAAERGARLFVGKAACASCHSGPLLSDQEFHNVGVEQAGPHAPRLSDCPAGGWCDCVTPDRFDPTNCLPIGARDGLRKLQASYFRRDSRWSDDVECRRRFTLHVDPNHALANPEECDGRVKYYSLSLGEELRGAWRTPSLRDVALSAPYMHNGMFATLAEVVEHYDRGGATSTGGERVGELDPFMQPLHLSAEERADLVAFLESLTGRVDPALIAPPPLPPATPRRVGRLR